MNPHEDQKVFPANRDMERQESESATTAVVTESPTGGVPNEDTTTYKVVVNHEDQYSIWPVDRENPRGWRDVGKTGTKRDCLVYIEEVWTDMRPRSLRKLMEEMQRADEAGNRPSETPVCAAAPDARDDLLGFLTKGCHPVEVHLRPEPTRKCLREAIGRGCMHVRFTDTRGGTELGVRLDRDASDVAAADCSNGSGTLHVEGDLSLNSEKVRCVADIELGTFAGTGYLRRVEGEKTQASEGKRETR